MRNVITCVSQVLCLLLTILNKKVWIKAHSDVSGFSKPFKTVSEDIMSDGTVNYFT